MCTCTCTCMWHVHVHVHVHVREHVSAYCARVQWCILYVAWCILYMAAFLRALHIILTGVPRVQQGERPHEDGEARRPHKHGQRQAARLRALLDVRTARPRLQRVSRAQHG